MVEQVCIGVNPGGLGVATSPDFGLGVVGVLGGRERVSENTIAYFAQKASFLSCFFPKKERKIR